MKNAMGTGVKKTTGAFTEKGQTAVEDTTACDMVAAHHKAGMVAADQKAEAIEINEIEK